MHLFPAAHDEPGSSQGRRPAKISKKQNARMQLAAALIEADNDIIENRAKWLAAAAASAAHSIDDGDEPAPRPLPLPKPKLASESAIFAPWRGRGDSVSATQASASRARSIRKPQIRDFLGISLPGDVDRIASESAPTATSEPALNHSRAASILSNRFSDALGAPSRPVSALSLPRTQHSLARATSPSGFSQCSYLNGKRPDTANADDAASTGEDIGLDEWGLDKFLSAEVREKIKDKKERKRAVSTTANDTENPAASSVTHTAFPARKRRVSDLSVPSLARLQRPSSQADSLAAGLPARAQSDIVELGISVGRSIKLDLLARIKLYRERQENLPPNQWNEGFSTQDETATAGSGEQPDRLEQAVTNTEDKMRLSHADTHIDHILPLSTGSTEHINTSLSRATRAKSQLQSASQSPSPDIEIRGPTASEAQVLLIPDENQDSLHRRESSRGYLGDSWSDQGSEMIHRTHTSHGRSLANGRAAAFGSLEPTTEEERQIDSAIDNFKTSDEPIRPNHMAGVGSFARSTSLARLEDSGVKTNENSKQEAVQHGLEEGPIVPVPLAPRTSRPGTPGALMASTNFDHLVALQGDPYAALALGPSPYSIINSSASGALPNNPGSPQFNRRMSSAPTSPFFPPLEQSASAMSPAGQEPSKMPSNAGLSTRQLQALARQSAFPDHCGIITPMLMDEKEAEESRQSEIEKSAASELYGWQESAPVNSLPADGWVPERHSRLFSKAFTVSKSGFFSLDKLKADIERAEPDLSLARWGQKKRKASGQAPTLIRIQSDITGNEPEVEKSLSFQASDAVSTYEEMPERTDNESEAASVSQDDSSDVDDDYISPPRKGPLKPKGIDAFLPDVLIMPALLEGSPAQPRSRLSVPEDLEANAARRNSCRQSGLHIPDGFVLHSGKGLPPIQRTLEGTKPKLAFVYPAVHPEGIGRRANMSSTALFRNQLVKHEEEREGWGWEISTAAKLEETVGEQEAAVKLTKKQLRKAKKAASKEAKVRFKRKRARAIRRRKRAQAQQEGKFPNDYGVPDESPVEDLSLTEDSEGDLTDSSEDGDGLSWHSDDEKMWIDEAKPAGKLFGKSLMDVAEEKQLQRTMNRRFYGQQELEDIDAAEKAAALLGATSGADLRSVVAPSTAARSFRDNPLGYNDTRERMQAAFGHDANWAREMQKRREAEAEEAEIRRIAEQELAKEKEEKERRKEAKQRAKGIFRKGRKNKEHKRKENPVENPSRCSWVASRSQSAGTSQHSSHPVQGLDVVELPMTAGLPKEQGENEVFVCTHTPIDPPQLDLPLSATRTEAKVKTMGIDEWLLPSSDDADSDSEDEASRRERAYERVRLSRSLGDGVQNSLGQVHSTAVDEQSSEEDEIPLSQLKRRTIADPLLGVKGLSAFTDSSDEEEALTLGDLKRRSMAKRASAVAGGAAPQLMPLQSDPEDEEVPLAQLKDKIRTRQSLDLSTMGLNLVSSPLVLAATKAHQEGGRLEAFSTKTPAIQGAGIPGEAEDSDEDRPIGLRQGAAALAAAIEAQKQTLRQQRRKSRRASRLAETGSFTAARSENLSLDLDEASDEESSSDEDLPLGFAHPQAAIIARQAATIKRLQAEAELARTQHQQLASPFPQASMSCFLPSMPSMNSATPGMPAGVYRPTSAQFGALTMPMPGQMAAATSCMHVPTM